MVKAVKSKAKAKAKAQATKIPKLTLKDSELRYRRLFETAQDGILILEAKTGKIEDVNPFLADLLGYAREEFINKRLWELGAFQDIQESKQAFEALQQNEYIRYEDLPLKTKNGDLIDVEFVSNVYFVGAKKVIQCNIRDITATKQAVKDLRLSEERFRARIENSSDLITVVDMDGNVQYVSPSIERLLGYSPEAFIGTNILEKIHLDDHQEMMDDFQKLSSGLIKTAQAEIRFLHQDGSWRIFEGSGRTYLNVRGDLVAIVNSHDITERKISEALILRQLDYLTATGQIDRLIAGNQNLSQVLEQILIHVAKELDVDAVDILVFSPESHRLKYSAAHGFRTVWDKHASVRLGESYAGRAAQERRTLQIPDQEGVPNPEFFAELFPKDDFVCYFGVPLIARGQLKGVLEIFNRTALAADTRWLDFLHSLAAQTAIALESAALVENLQHANLELSAAYNSTIEGWSRALDMRDEETAGHSMRVTEMTQKLAVQFNLPEAELIQIRWGSLLHDIGKMGIPDEILLKPGPLTEAEWVIMRKHPVFAYQMLSPIRYLRSALDIPYCHHEKWDGSGYPRGLRGDEIPFGARIFAVADVWDALTSERPYRPAWTEKNALAHIRESSGTHFDPQVVELFMQTAEKTGPRP
ncbi:MAG: PAS domain S-box protein [Anaerolineae bacterium]|nr:MAG: PAS domain S-box protein [Anaerolineae bacterium]